MQTILVTGCAGFIGSHLTDTLLKDEKISIIGVDNYDTFYSKDDKLNNMRGFIDHPRFQFLELDLSDSSSLNRITKVDTVVHLAAKAGVRPSILNPKDYIQHNILATQNLLEWMQTQSIKNLVFASSSSVYGNNEKCPFEESDNVDNPISPYAFTKKSCELLNYTYHHLYNFNIINLRFFTVYGPRQRPDLAINKFVSLIQSNQTIQLFGDGSTSRDYTYVTDTVDGIMKAINYIRESKSCYEIINLGNNQPVKLNDLISTIESVLETKASIEYTTMQEGDVNITYANIDKAINVLNYNPKVKLEEGIRHFVNWKKELQ